MTVWNGDRGETYFYQSELPYDVTQANFGDMGYVSYRIADNVTAHAAYGAGVYTYFRDYAVTVETGIAAPEALVGSFHSPLGVFLNGLGTMNHVINGHGDATTTPLYGQPVYVCPDGDASAVEQ